jgi:mycofactocin system transcriptional regulator
MLDGDWSSDVCSSDLFSSKNDLPWGDFEVLLDQMRAHLRAVDPAEPLIEALRGAVVEFNRFPADELPYHRNRMWLLLNVPSLVAHSTLRYASWRRVIAEYVAERRGERPDDLTPQTVAWACLGICLGAYEQWLAHEDADLLELLDFSFATAESIFGIDDAASA